MLSTTPSLRTTTVTIPPNRLSSRISRLDALSRGLHCEEIHVRQTDGVLLYLERLAYMAAIRQAASGLETARIVLAKARQRMEIAASQFLRR
jgi:hypothetical protein